MRRFPFQTIAMSRQRRENRWWQKSAALCRVNVVGGFRRNPHHHVIIVPTQISCNRLRRSRLTTNALRFGSASSHRHQPTPLNPEPHSAPFVRTREVKALIVRRQIRADADCPVNGRRAVAKALRCFLLDRFTRQWCLQPACPRRRSR